MMDFVLEAWVSALIEKSKAGWMLGQGKPWQPGEKLRLLFAGYNGTRNMGSDVRVEEMLRQLRYILGAERVAFSVMTQVPKFSRGYFESTVQVHLPDIFPPFLSDEVPKHHGVVACEGSMFKSKFANALTTMMIGSLGIAAAQNKLSVGYGAEAGHMDPLVAKMCARYCQNSLVITRNEESRTILRELGVPNELGTDTAWTFEPHPAEFGRKVLREVGWDGSTPVLVVCPINPFEWPVKASVAKFALHGLVGAYKDSHYRSVYFHNSGPEADRAYEHYLDGDRECGGCIPQAAQGVCDSSGDGAIGCASGRAHFRKAGRRARVQLRGLQHVRIGERFAGLPHDGIVALSRDCDVDAGAGAVGGDHDG